MGNKTLDIILYIFIALAVVLSVVNFSLISARSEKVKEAVLLAEKENKPAKLELIKIISSSCQDCFDINPVIETLKKANVNVTSEKTIDFSSQEAKQLISQYNIEKLPTVVVLGEVNKSSVVNLWNQNWYVEMADGTQVLAVYSAVAPPYVDAASGDFRGLVALTHILDESCPDCADLMQVISFFKQQNVKFSSEKTIDYTSQEAKDLIAKFEVQKVPALIISKDILDYPAISQVWDQLNTSEKQGFYALHTTVPPYRDLATNKIEGLVTVIYLNDSTCASCYDVQINRQILERNFGVVIANETTDDINSENGRSLVKQYNITKVPIMLASPDASVYAAFTEIWQQVGNVAKDGWYVMRKPEVLGTYKDLAKGIVVNEVTVYAGEFEFQPNAIEVKKGETVRLTFINAGTVEHDFVIDELNVRTKRLQPRTLETIEFVADKSGAFSFYCSVEGHRQQGMEGSITISQV
ncbi:MAG: cupredoxin domain-containing protein [Candidatus Aenigmarchaeota archaeon]|nr:cupredoxin domain-containing protein [Candidatus Aenigmarchaeota archaeon]